MKYRVKYFSWSLIYLQESKEQVTEESIAKYIASSRQEKYIGFDNDKETNDFFNRRAFGYLKYLNALCEKAKKADDEVGFKALDKLKQYVSMNTYWYWKDGKIVYEPLCEAIELS